MMPALRVTTSGRAPGFGDQFTHEDATFALRDGYLWVYASGGVIAIYAPEHWLRVAQVPSEREMADARLTALEAIKECV